MREQDCHATLNIRGEHFGCDTKGSHGIHSDAEAEAVWSSDAEVREMDGAHPDAWR